MTGILLVAEKINNTTDFIKLLREGTDLSISEIRECILTKKPFFDSSDYYDEDGEVEELIQEILRISKSRGDVIKIFLKYDDDSSREITEEYYFNRFEANKETSKSLDELDEDSLIFKNPHEMSREVLLQKFASGKVEEICDGLVAMAFYDDDWKWSQDQCLHFLENTNDEVRGLAATCLGHIARIHETLDRELVESRLLKHLKDERISGKVEDALGDIAWYLK